MSQAHLPDWYPDPTNPTMMRWWDGMAWTENTRLLSENPEAAPVPPKTVVRRTLSHFPVISGVLFLLSGLMAGIQAMYMNTIFSMSSIRLTNMGVPILLPFDWYLLLFPYLVWVRSFFTWGLIPPVIILLACAVAAFTLRRRPRTAMVVIAALMTVQNLLLLIPIFIDSGSPSPAPRPIFMPSQFLNPDATVILVGVLIVHVIVWLLPLIFAATTLGSVRLRRRFSIAFLIACAAYVAWYLGSFLATSMSSAYLLTPGPTTYTGSWFALIPTLMCLAAMLLYILPDIRTAQSA